MKPTRSAFSILLPCFSIGIWLALVVMPVAGMYFQIRDRLPVTGVRRLSFGMLRLDLSRDRLLPFILHIETQKNTHIITGINIPGVVIELAMSVAHRTWPLGWHPVAFLPDSWRALAYPFYCLPAWWFVGRAMDAVRRGDRIGWPTLASGCLLFLLCGGLSLGFQFAMPASDRVDFPVWVIWGFSLWTALFAVFPYAWFRQWRVGRKALA